jgi:nicotinate phosphoribosyltransferase
VPSILDNDLYQFTMSQYAWCHDPDRVVRYRFRNRTFAVPLGDVLDLAELEARLERVSAIAVTDADVDVLRALDLFDERWLAWLRTVERLPAVAVGVEDGHLTLTYEGPWPVAIFLETPVLATVTELYQERFGDVSAEGERRLDSKIRHLEENPQLRFMEFGTRRRHSGPWQAHVLDRLLETVPGTVVGTSNVELAARHRIPALGTMAHQLFMVTTALSLAAGSHDLIEPSLVVLTRWAEMFPDLRTLLPDTYTTPALLDAAGEDLAAWPAVRIDSGDPVEIGRQVVRWWRDRHEDPRDHALVFSDGLDLRAMSLLHDLFVDRTGVSFGWGTNLTNDVGIAALALVIKPDAVDGVPCVKLSDDLAKATGDRQEIARYLDLRAP